MSIVVDHLTKIYGTQRAVNEVSFEAPKGKITGFLGPNGAGKSTTMKIATGFVSPTSGNVRIDDISVVDDPLKVKHLTGYLPEHNPLYLDMYVKEYLSFIGSSYKLPKIQDLVQKTIELVGLDVEQHKKIRMLSKGYRQRVGLAQALIHDPEVLILDEPTTGLDPNQLVEIRNVIKQVSEEKTVILSTHIMQEVEALCDKVVIINKGEIVADDEVSMLKSQGKESVSYHVEFETEVAIKLFEDADLSIKSLGQKTYEIEGTSDPRKTIMKIAGEHELPLLNISKQEQSLEGVFHELTKKA